MSFFGNSATANRTDAGARKGISSDAVRMFIVISAAIVCLVAFLFGPVIGKNQSDISWNLTYSGITLVRLLFNGGAYRTYDSWNNVVTVTYPLLISYVALFGALLLVLLVPVTVLRYTVFKKSDGLKNVAGISCIACGAAFAVAYVVMMFLDFTVYDYYGNEEKFYNLFEIKPTMLVVSILLAVVGVAEIKLKDKTIPIVKRFLPIYGFMVVPLVFIFVFNLYPVVLQTVLSFKDFRLNRGVWGSDWVGTEQFRVIFTDAKMLGVIGRTLYISVLRLIVGIIPPLILSVCLYDLKSKTLRSVFQNIVYIPHFFSWVVVYAITYSLLSPEGLINSVFGFGTDFMVSEKWFMPIVIITAVWKELGWGTILYLAALSGVDTALFEAAKIDGASPMQRVWHITLPSIKNTVIFLTIMSLGNILKGAGGEQLLLFYSATTKEQALVIDTWLVWFGMNEFRYSLGAAMSFFQSLIGMILVLGCNAISKKTTEVGIW